MCRVKVTGYGLGKSLLIMTVITLSWTFCSLWLTLVGCHGNMVARHCETGDVEVAADLANGHDTSLSHVKGSVRLGDREREGGDREREGEDREREGEDREREGGDREREGEDRTKMFAVMTSSVHDSTCSWRLTATRPSRSRSGSRGKWMLRHMSTGPTTTGSSRG